MSCFLRMSAILGPLTAIACSFNGAAGQATDASPADAALVIELDAACTLICASGQLQCSGDPSMTVDCLYGCEDGTTTCAPIPLSNEISGHGLDESLLGDLTIDANAMGVNATINTDNGEIVVNGVVIRAGNNGIVNGVGFVPRTVNGSTYSELVVKSLTIAKEARVDVFGQKALAIYSLGDVVILGRLDASADLDSSCNLSPPSLCLAGPGGGQGGTSMASPAEGCAAGGAGNGDNNQDRTGGGGGGNFLAGAKGGDATKNSIAGGAGGAAPDEACVSEEIIPLVGGSGGGRGGAKNGNHAAGGGGGGAIQIGSLTQIVLMTMAPEGMVGIRAGINAAGMGGAGAIINNDKNGGGGGGGGGAILLEAPMVSITRAHLVTNGGGGGGGGQNKNNNTAANGDRGRYGANPASGGSAGDSGTNGGAGGARSASAQPGQEGDKATGGGGGAAGRIRINTSTLNDTGALYSPSLSQGSPSGGTQ